MCISSRQIQCQKFEVSKDSCIFAVRHLLTQWSLSFNYYHSKIKGWAFWFSSVVSVATTIAQPLFYRHLFFHS